MKKFVEFQVQPDERGAERLHGIFSVLCVEDNSMSCQVDSSLFRAFE